MTLRLLACLLSLSPLLNAEIYKPFNVLGLQGSVALMRFEDEPWPLEKGQDLPGDLTLDVAKDSSIALRVFKRVDMLVSGPARVRFFSLERAEDEAARHEMVVRVEHGDICFDPRFFVSRPSNITLDLPDTSFEVKSGLPFMASADPKRPTLYAGLGPEGMAAGLRREQGGFVAEPRAKPRAWPEAFLKAVSADVPVLILGRDYDKERELWPRPAVLGPALVEALKGVKGISLVEGSGSTVLAAYANNAIRSGKDFFVQHLAQQRGARWVVAGNLVVEELRDESPRLRRNPLMSAVAELRVLETFEGGDVLVSDVATTLTARAGRPLEEAGREALEGAALRAGRYLRGDIEQLLQGRAHVPKLLKVVFNGVAEENQRELRRGLSELDSLQRFFKRSFASTVYRIDVVLRKSEEDFLKQLRAWEFPSFTLEEAEASPDGGLVFTLRARPKPLPAPKKKRERPEGLEALMPGARFNLWRKYLLSKPGAVERFPFDPVLPVYFVGKKMFAILWQERKASGMNLKCIPDWSLELRREYPGITPGYHMNKKHWNTVDLDGSIPKALVKKLVDCSYTLVAPKPKKKLKKQ